MRIDDKIKEIENYLEELSNIIPENFDKYIKNYEKKAACERYFEKIIEAVVDVAFLVIKKSQLKMPGDDSIAFSILSENEIISEDLAEKLKNAKGMRNIITHEYGSVDDELVFNAITEELEKDVAEFLENIKKFLEGISKENANNKI